MNPNVNQAQERLQSETNKLSKLTTESGTLADKLGSALRERFDNPEIKQRNQAISEFFQTGARSREELPGLLGAEGAPARPQAVESLVAQRRSNALLPVMNLSNMIQARRGGIEDIINRGVDAFQAILGGQQLNVSAAQQNLNFAQDREAMQRAIEQQRLDQKQQEFANEFALRQLTGGPVTLPSGQVINLPVPKQATKTSTANEEDVLNSIFGTSQQGIIEQRPKAPTTVGTFSPGGQWYQTNDGWAPVIN